ncbi:MAG: iron-containing alcohol dehydrogenase [Candidatus Methylomirabilota bacterium]|jgi:alcohol dehydrogenase class IV
MFSFFNTVSRVVYGFGCLEELEREIKRLHGSRVLVITDPGIKAAGLLDPVARVLDQAQLSFHVFADVEPDPSIEVVTRSVETAKAFQPNVILGIGGGSSLDISKTTSVLLTNPGSVYDYLGMDLVPAPGVPLILIPTTAGTGSEVTSISVLSDSRDNVKKAVVSQHLFARCVMLDPQLTLGLPPHITARTGMDALVHAIESFTGVRATVFTDTLNLQAIRMIAKNLRKAYANGDDRQARENMLYASCIAGMAFSNTQNGLDHAIALAIGGRFHLPHGLLTAFICPWVMEYNLLAAPEKFKEIARAFGENPDGMPDIEGARLAVKSVKNLLDDLGISYKLGTYNVPLDAIPSLAKATMGATRLISNNPRKPSEQDVEMVLQSNY